MKKLIKNIYDFSKDMSRHNTASYAASVAFFFFMSFFPTLMFLFSILKYLPLTPSDITQFLDSFIPEILMKTVNEIIDDIYNSSLSLIPITVIATLWSANMGMMGLIRALNGVLGLTDKRNYFVLRLVATLYTVFLLAGLIISLIIMGFGKTIVAYIISIFPEVGLLINRFLLFRSIIIFIVLVILFTLIYTFLPAQRQRFFRSIPGAIVAAAGWIVVSLVLSIYIRDFNGFSVYGNLTALMFVLFWIYMCFTLLIVGAFLNKYYKEAIDKRYDNYHIKRRTKKEEKINKSANKETDG